MRDRIEVSVNTPNYFPQSGFECIVSFGLKKKEGKAHIVM